METIIQTLISSFDFTYCLIVNVLTYLIIKVMQEKANKKLTSWSKRKVLIISLIIVSIAYWIFGIDTKLLFNSAILAPVSWTWVFKPILNKFNLDYNQ